MMNFNKKRKKAFIYILIVIVLISATSGAYLYSIFNRTSNSPTLKTTVRNELWISDLNYAKNELPKKHKNFFFSKSENEFNDEMDLLISKIGKYNDTEIKGELAKIINSINDSHTSVNIEGDLYYPLSFFEFQDGIYLSNCSSEFKDLWGKKLVEINGYSVENLHSKLDPFVSKDNKAIEKSKFSNLLVSVEALKIAGITKNDDSIFTFEGTTKKNVTIKPLESVKFKDMKILSEEPEYISKYPVTKQNSNKNYWFDYIEKSNAIYVKYNSCSNMPNYSFSDFTKDVFENIDSNKVKTLVIDLRDNGGGNSMIFNPFLKEVKKRDNINRKENLFIVVGRKTFSSAILNAMELKNETNATLVGEPTGGKPNHFGEVKTLHLSNTNININYSSKYFKTTNEDKDSLYPDIDISLMSSSYFKGKDDFLEYILEKKH
jgi:hypothetical protein